MELPPPEGFTLAEVLITIGIIGIVAALTISTLIGNHQKKILEIKFKKGYSTLQNAYLVYSGINGNDINNFISENGWYTKKENITPFFDSFQSGTKCYGNIVPTGGKCNSDTSNKYWFSTLNFDGSPVRKTGMFAGGIELADNSAIIIFNNGAIRNSFIIILDTNGTTNKPNRVGYDMFFFTIAGNKVIPIAPTGTSLYSTTVATDPQGAEKTYYAVQNVCPTQSGKTYWECLKF